MWYGIGCGGGLILAGLFAAEKMRNLGGVVPIDFFAVRCGEHRGVRTWVPLEHPQPARHLRGSNDGVRRRVDAPMAVARQLCSNSAAVGAD
jgi:hypothetical protein